MLYNTIQKDGDIVNVTERLDYILKKHGWTRYRLSKESGIAEATITNIFHRGTVPTINTLEQICRAMNISLAEFFTDNDVVELTPEFKEFYETWMCLTDDKKAVILKTMQYMK